MKSTRLYILFFTAFLGFSAWGQQDVQLSQQQFSRININPASTGFSNYANAYLFARQQWMGFEGAPSTQMFNAQGFIEDIRSGMGLSILNDVVGHNKTFSMQFAYAHHMKMGEESFLSLGLSGGMVNRRFGGNIIFVDPEIDPEIIRLANNGEAKLRPDMNLGFVYSTPKLSFGFSTTHLTRYLYRPDEWFKLPLHAYAFAEYGIEINETMRVTPCIQATSVVWSNNGDTIFSIPKFGLQFDAGFTFSIKDMLWIGATYRNGDAIIGMIGFQFGPNLRFGYSYDMRLGSAFKNVRTFGSHEIMLNYRLRLSEEQDFEYSPRFFD
ncbi:MAG: PorP/SprF family type IX secretion system membrane protein [Bacteroidales bacterium]|jgi:type IX secretion system PorP/SprF family membrane protein|nr:PorP/SprF family type IX secretion system membrane protein [Bacteroidales bacterium]